MSISLRPLFVLVSVMLAGQAVAEGPAVDEVNGKLSAQGGRFTGTDARIFDGVLTAPVGHSYGAQIDAASGHFLDFNYSGVGGHFFWRDPDQAMLGVTASRQKVGSITANREGLESEKYLGNVTLHLRAGHQSGDVENGTYGTLGASWYYTENLAISLGTDKAPGTYHHGIGVEWQPGVQSLPGLAVFAHADRMSGDNQMSMFGIRYYFDSGSRSLLKRHRTGDPSSLVGVNTSGLSVTPQVCPSGQTRVNGACTAPVVAPVLAPVYVPPPT